MTELDGVMIELERDLRKILDEKTEKIVPENIKTGINVFGIDGDLGYESLPDKPRINNVELTGNKTLDELNIQEKGDYANISDIPTKVSDLENDSKYLTSVPIEYVTEEQLLEKEYATKSYVANKIAEAELSGTEVDLSGLATKDELNNKVDKEKGKSLIDDTEIERLKTVNNYDDTELRNLINDKSDFDGDYNSLSNKPNIPTKVSELENDKSYLTEVPSEYITEEELNSKGYLTEVPSEYITDTELSNKGYLTEESDPTVPKHVKEILEEDIKKWNDKVSDENYVHTDNNFTDTEKTKLDGIEENANNYVLPEDVVHDSNYVHTDNNFTDELKQQITKNEQDLNSTADEILNLNNNKVETSDVLKKVNMFHASIDNSNFSYVKGSADFTYEDVINTENCVLEVQVANEKTYLIKQEYKNINPPDPIAGRYVGFSNIIRTAGEYAELFLFVYDHENLPTDEVSVERLKDWGDDQYCVSSYQPVMMGNFLGKDIEAERNRDNLAPSIKASGDYTDKKCGVVLDYMQSTFAENIMTLVANAYTKKPVIIYDNPTGFEASNSNIGDDWHLTGLNLAPYKRLKFYVCSDGSSNDNYTPSHVVEMHLDSRCTKHKGMYTAGHTAQNPNNGNRLHNVTFAVNGEKTAIQFARATSLYGTASTASAGGRNCYLIEGYYD